MPKSTPAPVRFDMQKCEHNTKSWIECLKCDSQGYTHHECGDDTCACKYPSNNIVCDICDEKTGWWKCEGCGKFLQGER